MNPKNLKKIPNEAHLPIFVWMVAYVAKNTGWQEKDLLKMSFAKLLNYTHALLVSEGIRTRYKDGSKPRQQIDEAEFEELFK